MKRLLSKPHSSFSYSCFAPWDSWKNEVDLDLTDYSNYSTESFLRNHQHFLISLSISDDLEYYWQGTGAIDSAAIYVVWASFSSWFFVKLFGIHAFFFRIIFIRLVFRDIVLFVIFALFTIALLILVWSLSACLAMTAVLSLTSLFYYLFSSCFGSLWEFYLCVRLMTLKAVEAWENHQEISYFIH